jgi:hypothetical protein
LKILSGTKVIFKGNYSICVEGSLQSLGEADARNTFCYKYSDFTPDSLSNNFWRGVLFDNTSYQNEQSIFNYTDFTQSANRFDSTNFYNLDGGVFTTINYSNIIIDGCHFYNNLSRDGGVISSLYNSSPIIKNSIFNNNYSYLNSSISFAYYSSPIFVNNSIAFNQVFDETPYVKNGTFFNFISRGRLFNNIIFNNISQSFDVVNSKPFFNSGNLLSNPQFDSNYSFDPGFVSDEDLHLTDLSEAIDVGDNQPLAIYQLDKDFDGKDRINGSHVDLGAYEYGSSSTISYQKIEGSGLMRSYPNPFNNYCNIGFSKPFKGKIILYNSLGEEIFRKNIAGSNLNFKFDGSRYPSGVYYLVSVDMSEIVEVLKIELLK